MKKIIFTIIAGLPFAALAQQEFTISGSIGNVKLPATAYVVYQQSAKMHYDSATVQHDGRFNIKGTVKVPTKAFVMVAQSGEKLFSKPAPDQIGIYLEKGTIEFATPDSMFKAKIGGTPLNNDQQELRDMLAPFTKRGKELELASKKAEGHVEEKAKIQKLYESVAASQKGIQEQFIRSHTGSIVSLGLLRMSFNPEQDSEKAKSLFNGLSAELKDSKEGKSYLSAIEKAGALMIGNIGPDFVMKNVKGEDVSLASFKGKYVLLDFWASWCGPCRQENPTVVKAYEKYKASKFTILGVSLDSGENGKKNWMDAIAKDGLTWEQVCDLKGWGNVAAQLYHVNAVPTNFLLDPTGKIIGKNLRGDELNAKLAAILK
ncbi:AhpC/TSA family protein [Pedobacter sp. MC2016-14]|uniref:TlpA disulfide reductase family protein n=1 Tax=Pedobacter sp. MC2016-14 TaxID=2897327 RepID=UPI001E292138|nr:TlpA disulfide reductase family protein [Pedobacter sp. MC2016-14]MCD0487807.1 AhpC/TSA family protein [Pedobacter sp. MC2016-14]